MPESADEPMRARPLPRRVALLHRFAWFMAGATVLLICSGGMVTSKGVGLAVPGLADDFRLQHVFLPISKWVGGIFFEHTHRLIAFTDWIPHHHSRFLARLFQSATLDQASRLGSLGAVVLQGVLGGLRVTLLKDEIGIFHACLAQGFLGLLVVIALATSPWWQPTGCFTRDAANAALCAIFALVIIRFDLRTTWPRARPCAISIVTSRFIDFPLAYGQLCPRPIRPRSRGSIERGTQRRYQTFRPLRSGCKWSTASLRPRLVLRLRLSGFSLGQATRSIQSCPGFATSLAGTRDLQIALGAWTIWSNKAADIATASRRRWRAHLRDRNRGLRRSLRLRHSRTERARFGPCLNSRRRLQHENSRDRTNSSSDRARLDDG
jgi:cytochrome c oxidase assembly protein subunit 15